MCQQEYEGGGSIVVAGSGREAFGEHSQCLQHNFKIAREQDAKKLFAFITFYDGKVVEYVEQVNSI